jgi:hypothetical protein
LLEQGKWKHRFLYNKKYHVCQDLIGQRIGGIIAAFTIPNVKYVCISKVFGSIWSFLNHKFCYAFVEGGLMLPLIQMFGLEFYAR